MLGIWLEDNKVTLRDDLPIPSPQLNEVLIKVLKAGICHTDLELIKGYYPFTGVLGHEFVGEVVQGPKKLLNKRVVANINLSCNKCEYCQKGLSKHCPKRNVLGIVNKNGTFSEYITMPIENLYNVPDKVSSLEACFTEPVASVLQILEQIHIKPTDKVLIIGDGKIGQLVTQVLCLHSYEVFLVGHHPHKYLTYKDKGVIVGNESLITGAYFDYVIECSSHTSGLELALKAVKPKGTVVLKTTLTGKHAFNLAELVVNEISLIGSRCGPFLPALRLLANNIINITHLFEREYSLKQGLEAIEHAKLSQTKKIIINCEI